jgi:hypothetical protein
MSQLLSNLPTGAKVKFGKFQVNSETAQSIVWTVVAKNHQCTPAYPTNAITLHAAEILDLRCFDAKEPSNSNSDRQSYGNNRYSVSNLDQWLNKDAAGGAWYSAAHSADQSPNSSSVVYANTPYASRPGFLNGFTDDEKAAILSTTIRVVKPSVDGGSYEDIQRKVFLPSTTEVGLSNENNIAEGAAWGYYTSNTARIGYLTQQCFSNTPSSSKPSSKTTAWYWWLRTPNYSNAGYARRVGSDGRLYGDTAYAGYYGVRPALNLSSSLLVSDSTDADGCYTFVGNQAPTKPSSINVPASIYGGKSATISWGASTDPDGNLSGYILQRKVGTGSWTQVYKGANRSYADSITYGWTTVQYRVCAYDSASEQSDWQTSASRTVINNQAPVISGSDGNLGIKTADFSQTYTVNDADGDTVTVEETIDNKTIRSYVVTLGATNTFSVTGATWLEQSNGSHTMKIKATDSFGNSTTRTYTFAKSVSGFTIQNTEPYSSDTRPTRIKITVTRNIPAKSTFKVYVCNNGYDTSPTWEDATTSVTGGLVHVFENTTKTGAAWGVIIKVVVTRGDGEGACYVSQIGGNFE